MINLYPEMKRRRIWFLIAAALGILCSFLLQPLTGADATAPLQDIWRPVTMVSNDRSGYPDQIRESALLPPPAELPQEQEAPAAPKDSGVAFSLGNSQYLLVGIVQNNATHYALIKDETDKGDDEKGDVEKADAKKADAKKADVEKADVEKADADAIRQYQVGDGIGNNGRMVGIGHSYLIFEGPDGQSRVDLYDEQRSTP